MVAHRSGGPQMDIVIEEEGSRNGFLAADENEFAAAIVKILKMSPKDRRKIREAARFVLYYLSVASLLYALSIAKMLLQIFCGPVLCARI